LSCGKRAILNSDTTVTRPQVRSSDDSEFSKFQNKFNNLKLSCNGQSNCPANLVFLGFFNPSTLVGSYCNGLIVSDGKVVVPSKCISRNLLATGESSCSRAAILKDPKTQNNYECKRVSSIDLGNRAGKYEASSITSDRDYIVLEFPGVKLQDKNRLSINKGFEFYQDLSLYYYEVGEKEKTLNLQSATCSAYPGTYLNPLSKSIFSPNISVNCPGQDLSRKETLGAILFKNQFVLGFFYHSVSKSLLRSLRKSPEIIFDDTLISSNGSWMNFICWDLLNPNLPNECFVDYNFDKVGSQRAYLLDFKISNEQLYLSGLKSVEKKYLEKDLFIKWDIVVDDVGLSYEVVPKEVCFHKIDQWPEDMKRKFEYDVELNKHIIFPSIANNFRVSTSIVEKTQYLYTVKFNSKKAKKKLMTDVEILLSHVDIYGNRRFIRKEKIKNFEACK